ncbi:MAG: hypothetical protein J0H68_02990 [Sphingobacteriia bacterium]|nr:hypothetical protein [Sphingobacteriia bacterium]
MSAKIEINLEKSLNKYFVVHAKEGSQIEYLADDIFYFNNQQHTFVLPKILQENLDYTRALTDVASFYTIFHDEKTFVEFQPLNEISILKYQLLERLRIGVICSTNYQGSKKNFTKFFQNLSAYKSEINDENSAFYTLLNKLYLNFTNQKYINFSQKIDNIIIQLKKNILNQKEYNKFANELIETLGSDFNNFFTDLIQNEQEVEPDLNNIDFTNEEHKDLTNKKFVSVKIEPFNNQTIDIESFNQNINYKIFTTEFDKITKAKELAPLNEIKYLRHQLDLKIKTFKALDKKLLFNLVNLLESNKFKSWVSDQREGILDSKKLASIVTGNSQDNYFKKLQTRKNLNTAITILIDNSGSMRGKPITVAAICSDILTNLLEKFGIKIEILGFTTKEWKGGQSKKKWQSEGSPKNPGRLNDLKHVIYKSFNETWQKAKFSIAVMLKEGLLKENIDGEALLWAYNRLAKQPESRKILIIISDGAPLDEVTNMNNESLYLENHLKAVIKRLEKNSLIDLMAIGIGHDVTRYYSNAIKIDDSNNLSNILLQKIIEALNFRGNK